ncbi:hypothetical protein SAMN04488054_10816 [Salibacterium qingdaonense]|uniref:Uncharacterized protein n=1 Tax=Salibacterium qingdaonense TaxID=266892 RepID=A0A1I4LK04_9BACI|nr:hypothetical protein SAMN04488054_10816 [Salibacterium qingdaonense]
MIIRNLITPFCAPSTVAHPIPRFFSTTSLADSITSPAFLILITLICFMYTKYQSVTCRSSQVGSEINRIADTSGDVKRSRVFPEQAGTSCDGDLERSVVDKLVRAVTADTSENLQNRNHEPAGEHVVGIELVPRRKMGVPHPFMTNIKYSYQQQRHAVYRKDAMIMATTTAPTIPQNPRPCPSRSGGGGGAWFLNGWPQFGQVLACSDTS